MTGSKRTPAKPKGNGSVSAAELLRELPGAKLAVYEAGTSIFREGSKARNCFVVTQGKVKILKRTRKGGELLLATVKAGEFLGEMAMLSGESRSASAVAQTRVKAITIDHRDFVALLKQRHPFASRLSFQLSTLLATRCHHLLRMIARQPDLIPQAKKIPPLDVHAVFNRVYSLWAV